MSTRADKKRVWCLYRVSTLGQVDKDDIPMQKAECWRFKETHPDWEITNEVLEKGVSGYKKKASEREALGTIMEAARRKEFDVLLVYMLDRLGRRTDDTPVVIQLLCQFGIEIWTTREGQIKNETHSDELVNFLHTWLASGESKKTSMRVSSGRREKMENGCYTGGYVAFGYDIKNAGRVNKKGQPVKDLVINEEEADVVRYIFHLIVDQGWGTHRIANHLNDKGIKSKRKNDWRATTIRSLIENPIYTGRMKAGGKLTHPFDNLCIIENEVFHKAIEIVKGRAPVRAEERHGAMFSITKKEALLNGLIYCGSCGSRLGFNHCIDEKTLANGEKRHYERNTYRCYKKIDNRKVCTGQSTFMAERVNEVVLKIVRRFFQLVTCTPKEDMLNAALNCTNNIGSISLKHAEMAVKEAEKAVAVLEEEAVKALMGEKALDVSIINDLMPKKKAMLEAAVEHLASIRIEIEAEGAAKEKCQYELQSIHTWADTFEDANPDIKRMIIAQLLERVTVQRGYKIHIDMSITANQFFNTDTLSKTAKVS